MLKSYFCRIVLLSGLVLSVFLPSEARAERQCLQWLKKNMQARAARCYLVLAHQQYPPGKQLSRLQRKIKANYLLVAIRAYRRLARRSKRVALKAWYTQKAAEVLARFPKENLCTPSRCNRYRKKVRQWQNEIGWATLKLTITPLATLTTRIEGYQYRFSSGIKGEISLRLRPGPYTIVVSSPNGSSHRCRVYLQPVDVKKMRCFRKVLLPDGVATRPPVRRPDIRRPTVIDPGKGQRKTALIVTGIGGALVLGGGVVFGLGQADFSTFEQGKQTGRFAGDLVPLHESGTGKTIAGLVGMGVGAAVVIVGAVLVLNVPASPNALPAARSTKASLRIPVSLRYP